LDWPSRYDYEALSLEVRRIAPCVFHSSPEFALRESKARGRRFFLNNRRRWITVWILVALLLGILIVLRLRHGEFDWNLFTSTLAGMKPAWLSLAVFLSIISYYGRALRWAVLIRHQRSRPNLWGIFSATAIGFSAIFILGRPGELVRPYLIASKEKLSFSSQLAAWLLERFFDLLTCLLLFAFALFEISSSGVRVGPAFERALAVGGYFIAGIGLASIMILVVLWSSGDWAQKRISAALETLPGAWGKRLAELFNSFFIGVEAVRSPSGMLGLVAYTILEWAIIILCFLALFKSFPALAGHGLTEVLTLIGLVTLGSLVQIPGVGGGVQVTSIVVLTEIMHVPLEAATGVALIIWLTTFVAIVPLGAVLLLHEGINWSKIKEIGAGGPL